MDKKNKKRINNKIGYWFNVMLDLIFATIKLIFYTILILGSTAAFLLYLKQYPEKGLVLYTAFQPVFKILINILQILLGLTVGMLIGWLSFNILEPIMSKSKIKREKRREEFLDDLSEKLKKKLKKK